MGDDRSERRGGLPRRALLGGAVVVAALTSYLTLLNAGHDTWTWIFGGGTSSKTTRVIISDLAIRPATFQAYLEHLNEPTPTAMYSRALLRRHGLYVQPSLRIIGYRGQPLRLAVHLFDAATGRQALVKQFTVRAERDDDTTPWPRWFARPHRGHRFYAEYVVSWRRDGTWQDLARKPSPVSPPI